MFECGGPILYDYMYIAVSHTRTKQIILEAHADTKQIFSDARYGLSKCVLTLQWTVSNML
jgi:hypothetical protein